MGKKVYQTFEILAFIMIIVSSILFGLTFGRSADMSDKKKDSIRIAAVVLFVTGIILLGVYTFRMG